MKRHFVIALSLVLTLSVSAAAAPGDLDPTFGSGGVAKFQFGELEMTPFEIVADAQGRLLVAGMVGEQPPAWAAAIIRVLPTGVLDTSFGRNGLVRTDLGRPAGFGAVKVLDGGKILAAGWMTHGVPDKYRFAVVRYQADGRRDATFGGGDGIVTTEFTYHARGYDLAVLRDGTFVVVGEVYEYEGQRGDELNDFAIVKYRPNGRIDRSFSRDGRLRTDFAGGMDVAVNVARHEGKILVTGAGQWRPMNDYDIALAQYERSGTLDASFGGGDGKHLVDLTPRRHNSAHGLVVLPGGQFVVGASVIVDSPTPDFGVARFLSDGSLDESFGAGDGWASVDSGHHDVVTQLVRLRGMYYVGSENNFDFAVARFTSAGEVDTTFGTNGVATADPMESDFDVSYAIGAQQGKIVSAGYTVAPDDSDSWTVVLRYQT